MKYYIIFIAFSLYSLSVSSQNVYYGLPLSDNKYLNKGDLIIMNIPNHTDLRFNPSKQMDMLIEFLNKDLDFHYNIEINTYYGPSKRNMSFSQGLSEQLKKTLDRECKKNNYTIVSNGDEKPIFLDKDSPKYKIINTRIDILIE